MTADEIAETYVNGNISDARDALKRASKVKMLDVIESLTIDYGYQDAPAVVRRLVTS